MGLSANAGAAIRTKRDIAKMAFLNTVTSKN